MPKPYTIDFETFGIEGRPNYPPKPVGVAIKSFGQKPVYMAWGHPSKNNCPLEMAKQKLCMIWDKELLLFQNGKFDVDVAETHLGLPRKPWQSYHDTLFLLFLDDPHQLELGLKPSAERLLGMKPEEQDAVCDWLLKHQPVEGVKISASKSSDHYFARYIAYAPGDIVGRYARGDVDRTEKLFKLLYEKTVAREMLGAYDRERELMLVLLEIERQGIPVDLPRLSKDLKKYGEWHNLLSQWVLGRIKAVDVNLDSGPQLVAALDKAGKLDVTKMARTAKTHQLKSDKENLAAGLLDTTLAAVLKYRTQLGTCLRTFMGPWEATATRSKGLIFTNWNQVKNPDQVGTRTGRLSSTPNFQNIPKEFAPIFKHELKRMVNKGKSGLPELPAALKGLPALPQVRGYIIPFPGHVLLDRDYSQQELRILGHFEDGVLKRAYAEDPWLDVHDHARTLINKMTGKNFDRKPIKNTGFGIIYGMGVGKLAWKSEITVELAKEVKDAYMAIFPGLKAMNGDMRQRAASSLPIRTWGGREYYCESPKFIDGQLRTFEYRMLNVLIQGSAADCTKEALIRYWRQKPKDVKLLLSVHDEVMVSCPKARVKKEMEGLRLAMESVQFDVPMLSEGSVSGMSWAELESYDERGKLV